jgi:hypothetical protein
MLYEEQVLVVSSLMILGGTGLEPVTSCVSNIISAHKYLSFIPLYTLFWHKHTSLTDYILATCSEYTVNINKADAKMTPTAVYVRFY